MVNISLMLLDKTVPLQWQYQSQNNKKKTHKTIAMNCFVFVISIKYFLMICVPGIFLFLSNILETLTPTVIVYNRMITWFGPVVATGDRVLEASTVP